MKGILPILSYDPLPFANGLTLEDADGGARVIFPVYPKWVYVVGIVTLLIASFVNVAIAVLIIAVVHRMSGSILGAVVVMRHALVGWAVGALWFGCHGVYEWWMYRRWARVAGMLTADENGLVLSRLGWLRMREKSWPVREITAIELCPVIGNLNRRRTVANLYVRRSRGFRLHFRLLSADALLPGRIAHELAAALHRPLSQK